MSALVELAEDPLTALLIPHGVAHGFYFAEPSLHLYGVTKYWDVGDELACHWADPGWRFPGPPCRRWSRSGTLRLRRSPSSSTS